MFCKYKLSWFYKSNLCFTNPITAWKRTCRGPEIPRNGPVFFDNTSKSGSIMFHVTWPVRRVPETYFFRFRLFPWQGKSGLRTTYWNAPCQAVFFKRGVTRCQNEVAHQICMSFLPPVAGCLLKKWFTNGGGHGHPIPPWLRPWISDKLLRLNSGEWDELASIDLKSFRE